MRIPRSIRFRVTVLATASTAVIVLVFGWLLTELVADDLVSSREEALAELAEDVDGLDLVRLGEAGAEFRVAGEDVVARLEVDEDGDLYAELFFDDDGEVIGAFVLDTGTGEVRQLIEEDDGLSRSELADAADQIAARIRATDDGDAEQLAVIQAAEDVFVDVAEGVDAARNAAWRIGPVLVLLSGAVTWFVVGRALAPTRRIAAEAAAIGTDSLDRRITRDGDGGEVDTIARVINDMLDRIEDGVRREQRFVADASHELRTPLATARMAAELAARDAPSSMYPPQLIEEVDRMRDLIDDLLALARDPADRPAGPVRFDHLVAAVAAASPDAAVTTEIAADVVVAGRDAELRRVVVNLLDNARRYADRRVIVSLAVEGGAAVLTVDDDGPGIAEADRERVFDRFARLDEGRSRDDGGAGLGLAIARSIVVGHEGTIDAGDAPIGGARITVRLPTV